MILRLLHLFPQLINELNKATVQKLLIYVFAAMQLTVVVLYKNEISLLLVNQNNLKIEVENIAEPQEKCFNLRTKYGAESVLLYVYQPRGLNKTYKERIVFSNSSKFTPLSSMVTVNLFSRSDVVSSLIKNSYCILTPNSNHVDSYILDSFEMKSAVITSIRGKDSKDLVGEVVWIFKDKQDFSNSEIHRLIAESQIFAHYIQTSL